ncbi:long-chain fatty acid--CoA ligase [candidate division KSB1 bacterium 4484_219]|nr:MAG: long-chain fatty acid--CoA ligase [candidate division KSB1 bacterium 4484_219]
MEKPWLKHYEEGVPHTLEYPQKILSVLLQEVAEKHGEKPAIFFFGRILTFDQLNCLIDRFAAILHHLGIGKGDRVAIVLPNLPQYPIVHYAIMRLGAVIVPVNPLYVERELKYQLNDSGAKAAIVLNLVYPRLKAIRAETSLENIIVTSVKDYLPPLLKLLYRFKERKKGTVARVKKEPGVHFFMELMKQKLPSAPEVKVSVNDVAMFLYTGGTTGVSKGTVLTHENLVANAFQTRSWVSDIRDGEEVILSVLPFFHSYGMTTCMHLSLVCHSKALLVPRFDTRQVLKLVQKHRVTIFPGVPTMYIAINNYPDVNKYDLSSIRACISGGAALPVEVQRQFERLTGGRLVEGYGLSEASPVTHANPLYGLRKEGSIGVPFPSTEAKIVDLETCEDLPVGEIGELAVRGPQVMQKYWNRPEETQQTLRDGWLLTGDVARMDEDGYFYIVDRKKELIITSGFNVYPREIEEVLFQHPKVAEAAVIGVPDAHRGEVIKAYVVVKEGKTATTEEIISFCQGKLARFKIPKIVEFRPELPKSMIGKVLRRVLIEEEKEASKVKL